MTSVLQYLDRIDGLSNKPADLKWAHDSGTLFSMSERHRWNFDTMRHTTYGQLQAYIFKREDGKLEYHCGGGYKTDVETWLQEAYDKYIEDIFLGETSGTKAL
jgi:hypothetical protein